MKKIYFTYLLLLTVAFSYAQIGPNWNMRLPLDYETNPYPRQTIQMPKIDDANVLNANSLEELWNGVETDFIYAIDARANLQARDFSSGSPMWIDMPDQDAADHSAEYTVMAGDDALYVLYHVTDNEVDPANGDKLELAFAPYVDPYDPGRQLYLDTTFFRYDGAQHAYVWGQDVYSEAVYTDMARYSTWNFEHPDGTVEGGAYKVDIPLASNAELYAGTVKCSLKGPDADTLGVAGGGSLPIAMQTLYEPTSSGYLCLAIVPWSIMLDQKPENPGDAISLAAKTNDWDSDNPTFVNNQGNTVVFNYGYWGNTTNNDAYWAIAYYGAIAELVVVNNSYEPLNDVIKAYYSGNELIITKSEGNPVVDIYNINGVRLNSYTGISNINLSFLQAGYYVADVRDSKGNRSLVKFAKTTY